MATLPVDGGILLDSIGKGDPEIGWNDLANRELKGTWWPEAGEGGLGR